MRYLQGVNQSRCGCTREENILKNVKQEFINLLYHVYFVDRTTLKDQIDIKVSTLFRNMYEERHAEEHKQVTTTIDDHIQPQRADVGAHEDHRGEPSQQVQVPLAWYH